MTFQSDKEALDAFLIDSIEFNSISILNLLVSISFCCNISSITRRIVEFLSKVINCKEYKSSFLILVTSEKELGSLIPV